MPQLFRPIISLIIIIIIILILYLIFKPSKIDEIEQRFNNIQLEMDNFKKNYSSAIDTIKSKSKMVIDQTLETRNKELNALDIRITDFEKQIEQGKNSINEFNQVKNTEIINIIDRLHKERDEVIKSYRERINQIQTEALDIQGNVQIIYDKTISIYKETLGKLEQTKILYDENINILKNKYSTAFNTFNDKEKLLTDSISKMDTNLIEYNEKYNKATELYNKFITNLDNISLVLKNLSTNSLQVKSNDNTGGIIEFYNALNERIAYINVVNNIYASRTLEINGDLILNNKADDWGANITVKGGKKEGGYIHFLNPAGERENILLSHPDYFSMWNGLKVDKYVNTNKVLSKILNILDEDGTTILSTLQKDPKNRGLNINSDLVTQGLTIDNGKNIVFQNDSNSGSLTFNKNDETFELSKPIKLTNKITLTGELNKKSYIDFLDSSNILQNQIASDSTGLTISGNINIPGIMYINKNIIVDGVITSNNDKINFDKPIWSQGLISKKSPDGKWGGSIHLMGGSDEGGYISFNNDKNERLNLLGVNKDNKELYTQGSLKVDGSLIAINGIKGMGSWNSERVMVLDDTNDGSWRDMKTCPAGKYVCGLQALEDNEMYGLAMQCCSFNK
jgi:hypothetical protein